MITDLQRLKTKRILLASGLFDAEFYRATYAELRASPVDPLTHYLSQGEAEGRSPNPIFLPFYYRRHAMMGALAESNALAHYAEAGERLGYKPHPAFDPRAYLAANPKLADFVDRPLFHFLKIGRGAGLPVAPAARGEALARVLEAQAHASGFEASARRDHHSLMLYKEALVSNLGVDEGFAFYRQVINLPDSDRLRRTPIAGLYEFAKDRAAAFHEIAPAGEPLIIPASRVLGEGAQEDLAGAARAIFVACLIDARVRGRSGVIETADLALFDWQNGEQSLSEDELDFDPAIFHAEDGAVWIIGPDDEDTTIEFDEAFMLLGPRSDDFRHWMLDLLPRYLAASASGALPPVPVLVDERMPATQRQSLELMLPAGVEIISLPSFMRARVRRLWCAPSAAYVRLCVGRRVGNNRLSQDLVPRVGPEKAAIIRHAAAMPDRNLATHADRCRVLEAVTHGVAVVNRLIGTTIPFEPVRDLAESLRPDALADPDQYYAAIMAALFGRNFAVPRDFDDLFAGYRGLTGIEGVFDGWAANAVGYRDMDDDEMIAVARQRLVVHPIDLLESFSRRNYVSVKINHQYWEDVACVGLSAASKPLIREYHPDVAAFYRDKYRSRFGDLLVLAMRQFETERGCFIGPGHAFGLGITNGDATYAADLQLPLHPIVKNALTGILAFFDGCAPGATVHAADAAAIKNVVWMASLDRLVRLAAEAADCVVFIAPTHLAGIGLRPPAPPQNIILVPRFYIFALWPTVMAGVAGQLIEILDRYRRVAIFIQATAMSAPIGALIHALLGERPEHSVHCFDFGQVLDVALDPGQLVGSTFSLQGTAAAVAAQAIPFVMTGA